MQWNERAVFDYRNRKHIFSRHTLFISAFSFSALSSTMRPHHTPIPVHFNRLMITPTTTEWLCTVLDKSSFAAADYRPTFTQRSQSRHIAWVAPVIKYCAKQLTQTARCRSSCRSRDGEIAWRALNCVDRARVGGRQRQRTIQQFWVPAAVEFGDRSVQCRLGHRRNHDDNFTGQRSTRTASAQRHRVRPTSSDHVEHGCRQRTGLTFTFQPLSLKVTPPVI